MGPEVCRFRSGIVVNSDNFFEVKVVAEALGSPVIANRVLEHQVQAVYKMGARRLRETSYQKSIAVDNRGQVVTYPFQYGERAGRAGLGHWFSSFSLGPRSEQTH